MKETEMLRATIECEWCGEDFNLGAVTDSIHAAKIAERKCGYRQVSNMDAPPRECKIELQGICSECWRCNMEGGRWPKK